MTKKELIEKLEKYPDDLTIQVWHPKFDRPTGVVFLKFDSLACTLPISNFF